MSVVNLYSTEGILPEEYACLVKRHIKDYKSFKISEGYRTKFLIKEYTHVFMDSSFLNNANLTLY